MIELAPINYHVSRSTPLSTASLPLSTRNSRKPTQTGGYPDRRIAVSVSLGGVTYVNQGLVAFARIASNFTDSTGDSMGGIGSTIAIKRARGGSSPTGATPARSSPSQTAATTCASLLFCATNDGTVIAGYAQSTTRGGATRSTLCGMPIASAAEPHLTVDAEGIVANADGTYWLSDEYGPYICSATGSLIQTIQPPPPILSHDKKGNLNFTANVDSDPATGRAANPAIPQSATIQDGALQYTRLLAYGVPEPALTVPLVGEWVVPLPVSGSGKVEATSEIHFVGPACFCVLRATGTATAGAGTTHADLFSIVNATDIHGTAFDAPATPVAPKGKLSSSITPATYVSFVDYADPTQLARFVSFGLHTGGPDDNTLIDAKWESLARAPIGPSAPDDFFLFTASDNDFMTTQGVSLCVPYDAGEEVDSQFVFRVTLPGSAPFVAAAM
ncbi:hypothetical protein GGX14DRAFT_651441 [Mycena pura]|uniref:Phytase-like domain-containing protein n=1 Tax=Mycena pura TaxID=153505 RepID=A0AAD6V5E9_9AGAR|nr:hypothetical protein GGX14DRAFT_651441 [Mycena pura]